jgi:hypothetical protein
VNPQLLQLLSNASAALTGNALFWQGGTATFNLIGTMGGATVSLQVIGPDGQTWQALGASTTVTATGAVTGLQIPAGPVRCVVTGGPPTGLYATLCASLD